MNINSYTQPHVLEHYAFMWSQVRLLVAALALILGGIPPALYFLQFSFLGGFVTLGLQIAWIVSGVASAYLIYRYLHHKQTIFGGTDTRDRSAFFISVISGLNLGAVGLLGYNIGMSVSSSYTVFLIAAILYLVSAYHLYARSRVHGKLF